MTKVRFILDAFTPELPEFPLPEHLVEEAQPYDGPMPQSLRELMRLLREEFPDANRRDA